MDNDSTYKIISKRGAQDVLSHLNEMKWKPGVSASYCPSEHEGGHNYEINAYDNELVSNLSKAIAKALVNKRQVREDTLAVVCLNPKFNKYHGGGEYRSHVDSGFIGGIIRSDYAVTLFLSDPKDYEGGELHVGGKRYKAEQGHAVIYECGEPHHVTPVTEGERVCAVTWIQSKVQDPYKRKLLLKCHKFMRDNKDNPTVFTQGGEIFYALQKMWMDT